MVAGSVNHSAALVVGRGRQRTLTMKLLASVLALLSTLVATDASAQGVDLNGRWRCIQLCRDGLVGAPAYVTQNGWEMNLLNEVGEPSRAGGDRGGPLGAPTPLFRPEGAAPSLPPPPSPAPPLSAGPLPTLPAP